MQAHIDYEDTKLAEAAREILRRHDEGAAFSSVIFSTTETLS